MRICCLNNYSLTKMMDRARAGLAPAHHGWGLQHLRQRHHEVLVAPHREGEDRRLLDRASATSRHVLGQLDQQLWAIRRRPDLLYAADQHSLAGVAMARRVLARGTRLVSVVHHPLNGRGRRVRMAALRRHDVVITLSQVVCRELTRDGIDARFLPWGPDLESNLYARSHDNGFAVSTGKSNRDIRTLVEALRRTGLDGRVFDLGGTVVEKPETVRLIRAGGTGTDPDATRQYLAEPVLELARAAGFVAIPIADPQRLTGLTEINDALALGKPIVITRSPYTPVDVEAIGCGITVELGDVDGWVAAIDAMRDSGTRREMGARGRLFAERSWNYEIFGTELVKLVDEFET